jgi:hypothetical protein
MDIQCIPMLDEKFFDFSVALMAFGCILLLLTEDEVSIESNHQSQEPTL